MYTLKNKIDINSIKQSVLANCDISDARYSGLYSVCNLALRLRDLYKWEKNLAPWEEDESATVLSWIGDTEEKWEALTEADFASLPIGDRDYDPFDTAAINAELTPRGYLYGAGYAHGMKPTFFLAECDSMQELGGVTVYELGRELARDLLTLPALTQDNSILFRKPCARLFLWDEMLYIRKSGRPALNFALKSCGVTPDDPGAVKNGFDTLFSAQKNTYLYHELGEIKDTVFDRTTWRQVIAEFSHTPVELVSRAVKDLLADTNPHGTLQHIIRERNATALALYVAFAGPLVKAMFPELEAAFGEFVGKSRWKTLETAVSKGFRTAGTYAHTISDIFTAGKKKNDPNWIRREIEARVLEKIIS